MKQQHSIMIHTIEGYMSCSVNGLALCFAGTRFES